MKDHPILSGKFLQYRTSKGKGLGSRSLSQEAPRPCMHPPRGQCYHQGVQERANIAKSQKLGDFPAPKLIGAPCRFPPRNQELLHGNVLSLPDVGEALGWAGGPASVGGRMSKSKTNDLFAPPSTRAHRSSGSALHFHRI